MKKLFVLTTLLIASIAFSETKKDDKKTAAKPTSALTKVDVTGGLKWTGFGVGKSHNGDVALKTGYVEMKGEEIVGGQFTLDMTSLKTADSEKLQGHLRSADFFDIAQFPEGTFKITKVEALKDVKPGAATHKITGELTIKGKTHTEELMATIKKAGTKWEAQAATEIKDRTQYDIIYNSQKFKAASALGDKLIQDNIKIELNVMTK